MPGGCLSTARSTAKHSKSMLSGTIHPISDPSSEKRTHLATKHSSASPIRRGTGPKSSTPTRCKPPSNACCDSMTTTTKTVWTAPPHPDHMQMQGQEGTYPYLLICLFNMYKVVDDLSLFSCCLSIRSPSSYQTTISRSRDSEVQSRPLHTFPCWIYYILSWPPSSHIRSHHRFFLSVFPCLRDLHHHHEVLWHCGPCWPACPITRPRCSRA